MHRGDAIRVSVGSGTFGEICDTELARADRNFFQERSCGSRDTIRRADLRGGSRVEERGIVTHRKRQRMSRGKTFPKLPGIRARWLATP